MRWEFGTVYGIISAIVALFTVGVSHGVRKPGDVSAYSVFNEGCRKLVGTVTAEELISPWTALSPGGDGSIGGEGGHLGGHIDESDDNGALGAKPELAQGDAKQGEQGDGVVGSGTRGARLSRKKRTGRARLDRRASEVGDGGDGWEPWAETDNGTNGVYLDEWEVLPAEAEVGVGEDDRRGL